MTTNLESERAHLATEGVYRREVVGLVATTDGTAMHGCLKAKAAAGGKAA